MSEPFTRRHLLSGLGMAALALTLSHPVLAAVARAMVCSSCHIKLGDNHCVKCGQLSSESKPAVLCSSCHIALGDNHCVKCGQLDASCVGAILCSSCYIKLGDNHCVKCGQLT